MPGSDLDTRSPMMYVLLEGDFQGIAFGGEASIESCFVLMVSSGPWVVHDLLIRLGLLILSGGGTDSKLPGVECTRSKQSMQKPIVAMNFDARSLLRATWRSGHKAMLMWWAASPYQP